MPRRPKLGQHFLASPRFRERIANALSLRPQELVVEIGAGQGAMTALLAERARRVIAIELDEALARALKERFRKDARVEVLNADILSADLAHLCRKAASRECYVFGNLPYYITSPILHHLYTFRACIYGMTLLMQREVAERITAGPGSRDYGYLSVLVRLYSRPRMLFTVPPGAFSPPPKVSSALVDFRIAAQFPEWSHGEEEGFLNFVKRCFAHKRKSLMNNLRSFVAPRRAEEAMASLNLPANIRAEQMSLERLASLYAQLKESPTPAGPARISDEPE